LRFPRSVPAGVAASVLLSGALSGCDVAVGDGDGPTEVVIAADLELSGSMASLGAAYQRALQLKIEQVNTSGLLAGRTLTLRVSDNRSDPTSSLRNVGTFADDPAVAAIVTGGCGECAIAAAKTINDRRVPTISLAAANAVSNPVSDQRYLFKLAPNAADSAAALVAELARAKVRGVAVLHADDAYGRGGLAAIGTELRKAGIDLVGTAKVRPTDTDLSQPVSSLVDAAPEALVVFTFADQAALAAISADAAGFDGSLYFDAAAAGDLFLPRSAAQATDNATLIFTHTLVIDDVIATTPAKAARKQWFRDYTSRYGNYSGVASFAADAVQLIAEAVGKVGGNRDRIREVLETAQMDGLSGPIRLTPDNHSGLMPQALTLLVARSGRWRLAS